jgi:hypothetical protein
MTMEANTPEQKPVNLKSLTSLKGFTQSEIWPMYANLILSDTTDEDVQRVNKMIIDEWSNAALILIKDKAWRIVKNVPKGQNLSKYI